MKAGGPGFAARNRTLAAALIAIVALGVPCAAWYAAGSRAAKREANELADAPLRVARAEAQRVANALGLRLEALRRSESRRVYLDYRVTDAREAAAAEDDPLQSPLAQGPPDPLVWAHFQVDAVGQLTLPVLHGRETSEVAFNETASIQRAIFEELECSDPNELDEQDAGDVPAAMPEPLSTQQSGVDWAAEVGELTWSTLSLGGSDALYALREVRVPSATLRQGFVVRPEELERLAEDSTLTARVRPGRPVGPTSVALPIDGVRWAVDVDAEAAIAAGRDRAAEALARFRRTFAGAVAAALVAGGLLVGMVHQADRLARQRARFAASAAHELRTPLAGLRMYGEMLADGTGDPTKHRTYARRVAGEADRLGRVVSNLLNYSRLERGALSVTTAEADLAEAVRTALDSLAPGLESAGALVALEVDDDLPAVRFDRDALHQILQNLMDNAEKYSRAATDRTIRVELRRCARGAELAVSDHGPGVAPEVRRKLFEPFVRDTSPDAPAGLGLGLALVRALAAAQNAAVAHTDRPGGGSRFAVTFPC